MTRLKERAIDRMLAEHRATVAGEIAGEIERLQHERREPVTDYDRGRAFQSGEDAATARRVGEQR